ncbi:MAG: T9SS type A sorting domain-containing protein [Saprospiraceae bacterium]
MEKSLLFVVFFTLITNVVLGQYSPILTEGRRWMQYSGACDDGNLMLLELGKDTTINGLTYREVIEKYCTEERVFGYLRCNEANSKMWFKQNYSLDDEEGLIMNLDMEVGDFFQAPLDNWTLTVTEVAEVNGRKVVTFGNSGIAECLIGPGQEPLRFIEGVGTSSGIYITTNYLLDCTSDGNGFYYQHEQEWMPHVDCDIDCVNLSTSTEWVESDKQTTSLTINDGYIYLHTNYPNNLSLSIFDLTGRTMGAFNISPGGSIRLPIMDNGLYVATLSDKEGQFLRSQMFIHHQ